jgi:hypothetical protein
LTISTGLESQALSQAGETAALGRAILGRWRASSSFEVGSRSFFSSSCYVAVVLIGFACVCIADHPGKALDRVSSVAPAELPLIEMWPLITLLLAPAWLFVVAPRRAQGRASPPLLQRFLF